MIFESETELTPISEIPSILSSYKSVKEIEYNALLATLKEKTLEKKEQIECIKLLYPSSLRYEINIFPIIENLLGHIVNASFDEGAYNELKKEHKITEREKLLKISVHHTTAKNITTTTILPRTTAPFAYYFITSLYRRLSGRMLETETFFLSIMFKPTASAKT